MEYIQENQILLYEELCSKSFDRDDQINKATIRFRENIKLANHIAKKFSIPYDNAIDRDDVYQEAYLGLWRACLDFDESKGYEFSTYAVPVIKGSILNMLRNNELLKTPKVFKDIRSALNKHGFSLPLSEDELDILISEGVASRSQLLNYVDIDLVHLDAPLRGKDDTEDSTFADVIPAQSNMDIGMELDEYEIESVIDKILTYIKPANRDLVEEWMYATLSGVKLSQMTLAKKYKKSQAHVGRILRQSVCLVQMAGDEIRDLFGI